MSRKCKKAEANPRLGTVGGQAVLEGVMMKSKTRIALTVRRMDNNQVSVRAKNYVSTRQKHKWINIPILRGIVNFVEMMIMSFSTLTESTEMLGLDEEDATEKQKAFTQKLMSVMSFFAVIIGVGLALFLFMFLPKWITDWIQDWIGFKDAVRSVFEGFLKIGIFVSYIFLTSLIKDIKRTYQYHGAEHKSIFCYESGEELTVENVKKQRRFHPRCGTSFIFVVLIISILASALLYTFVDFGENTWMRTLASLIMLPFLVGISFEFIMYAGRHDNVVTRILSAPGLWMQRITTREPDDGMIEVAIISIKTALIEEFPDFEPPFDEGYDINGKIKDYVKPEEKAEEAMSAENTEGDAE